VNFKLKKMKIFHVAKTPLPLAEMPRLDSISTHSNLPDIKFASPILIQEPESQLPRAIGLFPNPEGKEHATLFHVCLEHSWRISQCQ
jgi:hypothetical protein